MYIHRKSLSLNDGEISSDNPSDYLEVNKEYLLDQLESFLQIQFTPNQERKKEKKNVSSTYLLSPRNPRKEEETNRFPFENPSSYYAGLIEGKKPWKERRFRLIDASPSSRSRARKTHGRPSATRNELLLEEEGGSDRDSFVGANSHVSRQRWHRTFLNGSWSRCRTLLKGLARALAGH